MRAWSREVRQKPGGSGISREVELSEKSTPHLRPPDPITPFPFSIDLILCDYTTDACETASFRSTLWIRFSSVQFSSEGNANDDMIWGFKSLVFSPFDFFFFAKRRGFAHYTQTKEGNHYFLVQNNFFNDYYLNCNTMLYFLFIGKFFYNILRFNIDI